MGIKKRILSGVVSLIFVFTSMGIPSITFAEGVSATPIISFEKATTQTAITIPDFDWESTLGEPYNGKYGIQISKVADFSNVDITAEVPALVSHFVPNRELEKTTYYWRVKYIDELNTEGNWSVPQNLKIINPLIYNISSTATWGAIHNTFAEAIKYTKTNGGFAEIQFEQATYNLTQSVIGQSLMEANGNEGNVIINGQGSKFILKALYNATSPWGGNGCGFINLKGSKSIQVKNLSIDYADQSLRMIAGEVTTKSYIKAQNITEFKVKLLPAYRAVFDIGEFNQFNEELGKREALTYAQGYFLNGSQYRNDNDDLNREFQRSDQNDSIAFSTKNNGWFNPKFSSATTQEITTPAQITDNEVILTFQIGGNLNYFKIGDYWASVHKYGGDVFGVSDITVKGIPYVANDIVINDVTVNAGRTRYGSLGENGRLINVKFERKPGRVSVVSKGGLGTIWSKNNWVEGCTFQGTRDDMIHVLKGYAVFKNNIMDSAFRHSLWLEGPNNWIEGNTIKRGGESGIRFGGGGLADDETTAIPPDTLDTERYSVRNSIIKDNKIKSIFKGNGIGTIPPQGDRPETLRWPGIIDDPDGYTFRNLVITSNTIEQGQLENGIYANGKNLTISGNNITGNINSTQVGIYVDRSLNSEIKDNSFTNSDSQNKIIVRQGTKINRDGVNVDNNDKDKIFNYLAIPKYTLSPWKIENTRFTTIVPSITTKSTIIKVEELGKIINDSNSYSFNGVTGSAKKINDNVVDPKSKLTISFWINNTQSSVAGNRKVIFEYGNKTNGGITISRLTNNLNVMVKNLAASSEISTQFSTDNFWHHVMVVFDNGKLQLYIDGYRTNETISSFNTLPTGNESASLGGSFGGDVYVDAAAGTIARLYQGKLADVRIFDENLVTLTHSVPTNITGITSDSSVRLSWDASINNGLAVSYDVFKNGKFVGNTDNTYYDINDLKQAVDYVYTIKAKYSSGNTSDASTPYTVNIKDNIAPTIPTSLIGSRGVNSVDLSWGASGDNVGVESYNVYKNGILEANTPNTSYKILGLAEYTDYTFTVKAKDLAKNISGSSGSCSLKTKDGTDPTVPSGNKKVYIVGTADELKKALKDVKGGETISLDSGAQFKGNFVIQDKNDTSGGSITIKTADTVDDKKAVINGGTAIANATPGLWIVNCKNITMQNIAIINAGKGVLVDKSSNLVFDKLSISNIGQAGIIFRDASSNITLRNSTIFHTGMKEPDRGEGVYIGVSINKWKEYATPEWKDKTMDPNITGIKVLDCDIYDTTADNIDIKEGVSNTTIQRCTFKFSETQGIGASINNRGYNTIIQNNTFEEEVHKAGFNAFIINTSSGVREATDDVRILQCGEKATITGNKFYPLSSEVWMSISLEYKVWTCFSTLTYWDNINMRTSKESRIETNYDLVKNFSGDTVE